MDRISALLKRSHSNQLEFFEHCLFNQQVLFLGLLSLILPTLDLDGINSVCESVIPSSSFRVLLQVSLTVLG